MCDGIIVFGFSSLDRYRECLWAPTVDECNVLENNSSFARRNSTKRTKKSIPLENFAPIFAKPISARLIGNATKLHDINYGASSLSNYYRFWRTQLYRDTMTRYSLFFRLVYFYKYNEFLVSFSLFGVIRYSSEHGVIKMSENILRKSHVIVSEKILSNNRRWNSNFTAINMAQFMFYVVKCCYVFRDDRRARTHIQEQCIFNKRKHVDLL